MGKTLAIFNCEGIWPVFMDWLMMCTRGTAILFIICFNKQLDKPNISELFLFSIFFTKLTRTCVFISLSLKILSVSGIKSQGLSGEGLISLAISLAIDVK